MNNIYSSQPILIEPFKFKTDGSSCVKLLKMELNQKNETLKMIIDVCQEIGDYNIYITASTSYCKINERIKLFEKNNNGIAKLEIIKEFYEKNFEEGIYICSQEPNGVEPLMRINPIFDNEIDVIRTNTGKIEFNGGSNAIKFHIARNIFYDLINLNLNLNLNKNKLAEGSKKGKEIIKENQEENLQSFKINFCIEFTNPGKYLIRLAPFHFENPLIALEWLFKIEENERNENGVFKKCFIKEYEKIEENAMSLIRKSEIQRNNRKKILHSLKNTKEEDELFKKMMKGIEINIRETNFDDKQDGNIKIIYLNENNEGYDNSISLNPIFNKFKYKYNEENIQEVNKLEKALKDIVMD
ncbi:hypothetical protein Mgra_00009158 [Meloidogyne graminicola]|uniref:Uncharacterized protein n=1 Tax=Meloidogyne graminicola TaxID=189291 RepID=A0A8S9ZDP1_9BILA|nr:hypothetical protein Mgra_00009158 [Meloidogyne graminicola]